MIEMEGMDLIGTALKNPLNPVHPMVYILPSNSVSNKEVRFPVVIGECVNVYPLGHGGAKHIDSRSRYNANAESGQRAA